MIQTLLFIGTGSFVGGVARYLLSRAIQTGASSTFPFGTLTVNVLGCLLMGLLYGLFERNDWMNSDLRMLLTVGFCGGFTTFSTFAQENYTLFSDGNFLHFTLYSVLSLGLGLVAVYLGHLIVKMI